MSAMSLISYPSMLQVYHKWQGFRTKTCLYSEKIEHGVWMSCFTHIDMLLHVSISHAAAITLSFSTTTSPILKLKEADIKQQQQKNSNGNSAVYFISVYSYTSSENVDIFILHLTFILVNLTESKTKKHKLTVLSTVQST